ncbi:universal stress protein [Neorhodopirellula lusitana]|uniref:universal stress protein n=1 Tax=Neorhodopirellula lusitana TaxID=445327 RepID=UPI00384E2A67
MELFANTKTLVPIDFSEHSVDAVATAIQITSNENVYLVHVVDPAQLYGFDDNGGYELGGGLDATHFNWEGAPEKEQQHKDAAIATLRREFADPKYHGVHFDAVVDEPAIGITEYASTNGIGLIVLPSHGRTGVERRIIGSVAERVIRLAHCPVLVLRNHAS